MVHTDPTTDNYLSGVVVTEDRTESGSGTYDVADGGQALGYIYQHRGEWVASARKGGVVAGFLRSKDAVNSLVLAHRHA